MEKHCFSEFSQIFGYMYFNTYVICAKCTSRIYEIQTKKLSLQLEVQIFYIRRSVLDFVRTPVIVIDDSHSGPFPALENHNTLSTVFPGSFHQHTVICDVVFVLISFPSARKPQHTHIPHQLSKEYSLDVRSRNTIVSAI